MHTKCSTPARPAAFGQAARVGHQELTELDETFALFKFHELEAIKKSHLPHDTFTGVARKLAHEPDLGRKYPTAYNELKFVLEIAAYLSGDHSTDGALDAGFNIDADEVTEYRCK
jgi:hypothetical protein